MRPAAFGILAGAILAVTSLPALAQSTIRIEPRPFYGASVTVEEGVRVFRALPSHSLVVINPDNKTALTLGIYQTYNYSVSHSYIYDASPGGSGSAAYNYVPNRHVRRPGQHAPRVGKH